MLMIHSPYFSGLKHGFTWFLLVGWGEAVEKSRRDGFDPERERIDSSF